MLREEGVEVLYLRS
ncbi:hypothetical protein ACV56Z_12090 [Staphylococcus aureus]